MSERQQLQQFSVRPKIQSESYSHNFTSIVIRTISFYPCTADSAPQMVPEIILMLSYLVVLFVKCSVFFICSVYLTLKKMNERHTFPFTSSQWQELEHQALIFKYMACGIPIPPDLLYSIKRSFDPSSISSKFLSRQATHVGWNYIPINSGKKLDLEPSRCRRTDGKKWRCSKEVYPNSKYCERHMHRGKNRSRKPVETPAQTPLSSISRNTSSPFLPPQHGSYSRTPRLDFSHEDHTTNLLLNSNSYSQTNPDYRYIYGLKEEVDEHEHAFFSEPSGTIRSFSSSSSSMDDSWELAPLTMSSSSSKHHKHDHQSYDLKMDREPQKTIHHFFDEWPPKNRASSSWLDVEDKPITQLSISIPTLDFPIFGSRNYNDG